MQTPGAPPPAPRWPPPGRASRLPAMRRYGEPVDPRQTYRERPGAYAVILDGSDVLVTEQAEPEHEYQLPGGGLDPGESVLRALHRECMEETGWRIHVLRRLGAYQRLAYMPEYDLWARKVCQVYLAHPVRRLGPPSEPGHRAVWMPAPTALGLLASAGDRAFLARAARG
jgi:8-oxo-dGTP diphosphatase